MSEASFSVVSPVGKPRVARAVVSPSVRALDGKVIGQLWNYMFRGDEILAMARSGLQAKHPAARFVDHSVFGRIHGPDEDAVITALPRVLKEQYCDAVICGVGA